MDSVQLFKALGDKSRLRIVNTLRIEGPMYVELLSQRLELAQSTVSFHLKKLEECGIVKSNKEQYYVVFSLNTELLESKVIDLISSTNSDLDEQKEREIKYRNEVLKTYFKNERLTSIPVQKEKKKIILEYIVRGLNAEESYTIGALNYILYKYTMDIEKLREELIQNSYLYSREGIFFLTNTAREKVRELLLKIIPSHILSDITERKNNLSQVIKIELMLVCITTTIIITGFIILHIPSGFFLGILCGILDILPYVGTIIVFIPIIIYNIVVKKYLIVIGMISLYILSQLIREILELKFLSSKLEIHPLAIMLSIYIGAEIFGVIGILVGPIYCLVAKDILYG